MCMKVHVRIKEELMGVVDFRGGDKYKGREDARRNERESSVYSCDCARAH